jgi:hypothetical protein
MKEKPLNLHQFVFAHTARGSIGLLGGVLALVWTLICSPAWAYRTEKVCTEEPATASDPAKKTCKIVRMTPEREAEFKAELLEKQKALKAQKGEKKDEKKEEKKKSGH